MQIKQKSITLLFYLLLFFVAARGAEHDWKVYKGYGGQPPLVSIKSLVESKEGKIFVSPHLHLYTIENDKIDSIVNPIISSNYFNISYLKFDSKGTLWAGTAKGLAKYTPEGGYDSVSKMDYGYKWDTGFISGMDVDDQDNIWFLSEQPYLTKFDGKEYTDYDLSKLMYQYANNNRFVVRDSLLWYGGGKGVCAINIKSKDSLTAKIYTFEDMKLAGKYSIALNVDKYGRTFVSSDSNDLSVFYQGEWKSIPIPDSLKFHRSEWYEKWINQIIPINDSECYIFWSIHKFFCKYNIITGVWCKIDFPEEILSLFNSNPVITNKVIIDQTGRLWIGTANHGVIRFKEGPNGSADGEFSLDNSIFKIWIETICPNPVKDKFFAKVFCLQDGANNVSAYISDILGNKVMDLTDMITINAGTNEATILCPIDKLSTGSYIFVLKKGDAARAKNFIKIN